MENNGFCHYYYYYCYVFAEGEEEGGLGDDHTAEVQGSHHDHHHPDRIECCPRNYTRPSDQSCVLELDNNSPSTIHL